MVRCEERYPQTGSHTVLVVVVDRDAPALRERLTSLHGELFGPGKTDPLALHFGIDTVLAEPLLDGIPPYLGSALDLLDDVGLAALRLEKYRDGQSALSVRRQSAGGRQVLAGEWGNPQSHCPPQQRRDAGYYLQSECEPYR
jgi:hypothetical protein